MIETSLNIHRQHVASLSQAQRERLAYIDFRLYFLGEIGRPDLIHRFGLAPAAATRDLALYRDVVPQNIEFDGRNKIYRFSKAFVPLFDHPPQRVLSALSRGFGDGVNGESQAMLNCESPAVLSNPPLDVLAPICRAIYTRRPVAIHYYSMANGESERVIVPFALVDTGLRWHVRAYDRKNSDFRDFVLTRIETPKLLDEEPKSNEHPDHDIQWTRIVELELIPHPRLNRPEIIRMDYGMQDGSLRMQVRAAFAGYALLRWNVDSSPDHNLQGHEYRLWLKDHLALYGVKNAVLAPGYVSPPEGQNNG